MDLKIYLHPCPAPYLQIEISDIKHKGEHSLFANKQKSPFPTPGTKVKEIQILAIPKQMKISISVSVEFHGVGHIPYEVLSIYLICLF